MARITRAASKAACLQVNTECNESDVDSKRLGASFSGRLELSSFVYNPTTTALPDERTPTTVSPKKRVVSQLKRSHSSSQKNKTTPTVGNTKQGGKTTSHHFLATAKRRRKNRSNSYASPSTYAHMPLLPDSMGPRLIVMFVGLNPGLETSRSGHAYAHPSNLFWKLLYSSGLTPVPCRPEEDRSLPARFSLGLTNIVARPSRSGAELSKREMDDGVTLLHKKAAHTRAEAVCIVGKSIWESVFRVNHGRPIRKEEFRYGWQDDDERMGLGLEDDQDLIPLGEEHVSSEQRSKYAGARVFVATSTSGLAASLSPVEKEKIWRKLGSWVEQRRTERAKLS